MLNSEGQVIGVSVATFRGGQNLNFAIPSNRLKTLVAKVGPVTPLSSAKLKVKQRSIMAKIGGRSTEGVVGRNFIWANPYCSNCGDYSFSLHNQLRYDIKNVYCLVVFYDSQGRPIDIDVVQYFRSIPAGLAKRVATGKVDGSVQNLTTDKGQETPRTRVEYRILDFQLVN